MTTSTGVGNVGSSGNYASIHGLEMYYEIRGTGNPLVLLPGGLMTIGMMEPLAAALAETRQVIAVEPQGHGHTANINRPATYELMADDTAALIRFLRLERADVFGFSMGGAIALQTAIRHAGVVRKLVVVSAPCKSDGEYPEIQAFVASFQPDAEVLSPMREAYARVAPRPEDWPTLVANARQAAAVKYDWSAEVAAIRAPALIVLGDADTVLPAHAVEMFSLLGGGTVNGAMGNAPSAQLAILPGTTHFNIVARTDLLLAVIRAFLDAPPPVAK